MSNKLKIYHLLTENPDWLDIIKESFKAEEEFYKRYPPDKNPDMHFMGFEWWEVHTNPKTLTMMVTEKLLNITFKSRSSTYYKVANPELVKEVIDMIENPTEEDQVNNITTIDEDIFTPVVGYDDIKMYLIRAIKGDERINFLLEGPPSSSKSLMMLCIQNAMPDRSYYATGSRMTAPGLTDALLSYEPHVLLLDEIEKADMQSYAVLLSLMERGLVVETKYRRHRSMEMNTRVIAACNTSDRLPPELLSRFDFHLQLKPYTRDEFLEVCTIYLSKFENAPEEWAKYIAQRVWASSKIPSDIRKARGIARIIEVYNRKNIDTLISFEEKYSG